MAIIRANNGVITQINVFTVAPEKQQELIDLLSEAAAFASCLPGWISASVHRCLDGTRVVNYAQSKDLRVLRTSSTLCARPAGSIGIRHLVKRIPVSMRSLSRRMHSPIRRAAIMQPS
jgi:Antibiotic biosynthesis monooxygenase